MKKLHTPLQAALLLACTLTTLPALAEHREHGAHLHGHGQMNVLVDGNTLAIELDSPAANFLGFEHAPRDAAEEAVLTQAVEHLRDAMAVFTLPHAAGCHVETVEVESALLEDGHHDGHDHDGHDNEQTDEEGHHHADMEVSYVFLCEHPEKLDTISVNLFRLFPATEELEVQLLTPAGQGAAELTPDSPRLEF